MPYSPTAYPTDSDLVSLLTAAGLWDSSFSPFVSGQVQAAIDQFEMSTGYIPFLSDGTSGNFYYDPPGSMGRQYQYSWKGGGKILELDNGFVSIQAVALGYSIDNPNPSTQDLNRSLRFLPLNRTSRNLPIEAIEFYFNVWGIPQSIRIQGVAGYTLALPERVWLAILNLAAANFLPIIMGFITGGMVEMREADVAERFGADMFQQFITSFNMVYSTTLTQYKRMRVGL